MNRACNGVCIEYLEFPKIASGSKMDMFESRYSRKIVVPEPLVFSIEERPPLEKLAVKRVTKTRIGRNLRTTIFLEQNAGTHDSGSRKIVVRTTQGLKKLPKMRHQFCVP